MRGIDGPDADGNVTPTPDDHVDRAEAGDVLSAGAGGIGRRRMIAGSAIGAGALWVAPSVLSNNAAAAQSVPVTTTTLPPTTTTTLPSWPNFFPFSTSALGGWTSTATGSAVAVAYAATTPNAGGPSLAPAAASGASVSSAWSPLFVIPTGATKIESTIDYSSQGGAGFVGFIAYSNVEGTARYPVDQWMYGVGGTYTAGQAIMTSGAVTAWTTYAATVALAGAGPAVRSVRFVAETFSGLPNSHLPAHFRNFGFRFA